MKTLKNNFFQLIVIFSIFSLTSFKVQEKSLYPRINIETVRNDIISNGDFVFPLDYLTNLDSTLFNVFYLNKYCLVHIPYKNSETKSSDKFSIISKYYLKSNKWIFQGVIPYYYNISLLNSEKYTFISDNIFCNMIGECNKYSEISIFNGNEMIKKTGYDSFNKYNYFYWLLISNKRDEAIKAIGDTIKNQISLSNFIFDEKGIKSFDIYREVNILKDVNDSLLIKSSYNTIKVYVDN